MTRKPETISRIMCTVRNRNTKPELALRRALHERGSRYRLRSTLTGKPDIVFRPARIVVFVDGDYWLENAWRTRGHANFEAYHGCGDNAGFWFTKIRRNVARDRDVTEVLQSSGWTVLRCWESDIERVLAVVTDRVESAVRADSPGMATAAG